MKYLLLTVLMLLASYGIESIDYSETISIPVSEIEVESIDYDISFTKYSHDDLNKLISAMIQVESSNNDSAYCKIEEAVGCLQIRPIMVRECNRILKIKKSKKRYKLRDRWRRDSSIEMFKIVSSYHNAESDFESMARFWNGGPAWYKKPQTVVYWNKVKRLIKK